MNPQEKTLALLLRIAGGILMFAWPAIFLPVDWMVQGHRLVGLGEFPASPLVDYLTRSIAVLYGMNGLLRLVIAGAVRHYRLVVAYVAVMDVVFGVFITVIDLHAGMPSMWTLAEGPPVIILGLWMLWLLRSVPKPELVGSAG
jgi:hypothetical protein